MRAARWGKCWFALVVVCGFVTASCSSTTRSPTAGGEASAPATEATAVLDTSNGSSATSSSPTTEVPEPEQNATDAHEQELLDEVARDASGGAEVQSADPNLAITAIREAFGTDALADDEVLAESDGGATFTWTVQDRYDLWSRSWKPLTTIDVDVPLPHQERVWGYSASYVNPDKWPVTIDGCRSTAADGSTLTEFSWTIAHAGMTTVELPDQGCIFSIGLPFEGRYDVTLRVSSASGYSDTLQAGMDVEDILILSFGDSSASGEGNPDESTPLLSNSWVDRRCHRSRTSGHALTAQAIEAQSSKSSVTFLSFACSGATFKHGVLGPYAGQDPASPPVPNLYSQTVDLVSQVEAARAALCRVPVERCTPADMRRPDFIFLAIGVNDLGFADTVMFCADIDLEKAIAAHVFDPRDWQDLPDDFFTLFLGHACDENVNLNSALANRLLDLDSRFELVGASVVSCDLTDEEWIEVLGYVPDEPPPYCFDGFNNFAELRRQLEQASMIPTRGVYLSTYPSAIFSTSPGEISWGCPSSILRTVNGDEARFITQWGLKLNEEIEREAVRNGFYSVPGITDAFDGHGYCAPFSYFVSLSESIINELAIDGAIHPNRKGHEIIRDSYLKAIAAKKPDRRPTHRATVTVQSVRFDVPEHNKNLASIYVWGTSNEPIGANDFGGGGQEEIVYYKSAHADHSLEFTPGTAFDLPEPFTWTIDLAPSDVSLSFVVSAKLNLSGGEVTQRAAKRPTRPDDFYGPGDVYLPPGDSGGVIGFYQVDLQRLRSSQPTYRPGLYTLTGHVDFGGNPGFMTVTVCVAISEIPTSPRIVQPTRDAVCPFQVAAKP